MKSGIRFQLCPQCKEEGHIVCWLKKETNNVLLQEGILPPEEIHQQFSDLRVEARDERRCPNLNEINPYYKGRKEL